MDRRSPATSRGRGRPSKFGRPSQVVALTLPDDVVHGLRRVHSDLGWAIVKLLEGGPHATPAQEWEGQPDVTLAAVADRRSLIVINRDVIRNLPGVSIIPLGGSRAFLALDVGHGMSDLELAVIDRLTDRKIDIINGQKIWTTLAQYADWIFCLVRTDPAAKKQEGISFILVDMKTPGITVRPIITIDGGREVNEVFFDNVEVPAENLVGQENKGWDYAKFLLGNERTGIARVGASKAKVARIKELASMERIGDMPLIEDPRFREKLAAVEIELKALEMTQLRVVADERKREKGKQNPASSILKLKGSVIQQQLTELLMDVVGPYIMPYQRDFDGRNEPVIGPDYATEAAPMYFNYRKVSIYGGSNEIQRNIVAKAILGL